MINTEKAIGYYTDVFGNEITEYEQIEKYTVGYEGILFDGDTEGYNKHNYDNWENAKAVYDMAPDIVSIKDNEYGIIFENGDWH